MRSSIAKDTRRLERLFRRALLTAAAASQLVIPFVACSSSPGETTGTTSASTASASSSAGGGGGSHDGGAGGGDPDRDAEAGMKDAPEEPDPCAPRHFIPDAAPDAIDDCGQFVHYECGVPSDITFQDRCFVTISQCEQLCHQTAFNCQVIQTDCLDGGAVENPYDAAIDIDCSICLGNAGRRPEAYRLDAPPCAVASSGAALAVAAELEAASVHAFDRMERELAAHGAPLSLRRSARRSAADERRHARSTARLARRFGGRPREVEEGPNHVRSLFEMALENAIEGCVRETLGALVAAWQASHASEPRAARMLARIARDEARHAALSWALSRWASPRLDARARANVDAAARRAILSLRRNIVSAAPGPTRNLGLPSAAVQRALFDALCSSAWAELLGGARPRRRSMP